MKINFSFLPIKLVSFLQTFNSVELFQNDSEIFHYNKIGLFLKKFCSIKSVYYTITFKYICNDNFSGFPTSCIGRPEIVQITASNFLLNTIQIAEFSNVVSILEGGGGVGSSHMRPSSTDIRNFLKPLKLCKNNRNIFNFSFRIVFNAL